MENLPRPAALPTVYSSNPIGNETGDVVNCAIHSRVAAELKSQDTGAFQIEDIKPLLGAVRTAQQEGCNKRALDGDGS